MVEIARSLWLSRQYGVSNPVLILDEPTTVLVADEIRQLFDLLRALQKEASIVFISHRLEEVLELATRVVVFKDGQNVADMKTSGATVETIENLMVGHELAADHYQTNEQIEPGPRRSCASRSWTCRAGSSRSASPCARGRSSAWEA